MLDRTHCARCPSDGCVLEFGPMLKLEDYAKFIYNSNRLDGVHIDFDTTTSVLAGTYVEDAIVGLDKRHYFREHVTSHYQALRFIEQLAVQPPYAEYHLREVHRRLMSDVILSAGEYRECTLRYRMIPPVPAADIEQRLERVVAYMNDGFSNARDKAVLAWQVHHELLFVHPFIEGNGRTARLLYALMRTRAGLDMVSIPYGQHERYHRSIVLYGEKVGLIKPA